MGDYLRGQLREALSGYEMVQDIRGIGLLNGIAFTAPRKLSLRIPFEAFLKRLRNIRSRMEGIDHDVFYVPGVVQNEQLRSFPSIIFFLCHLV